MAVHYLRPNTDDKTDWTEVPGGAGYTTIDDPFIQPQTPTLTDYIESTTHSQQSSVHLQNLSDVKSPGEDFLTGQAWMYVELAATGAGHTCQMMWVTPGGTTWSDNTAVSSGWFGGSIVNSNHMGGTMDWTDVDNTVLLFTLFDFGDAATSKIHVAYVEIQMSGPSYMNPQFFAPGLKGPGREHNPGIF